MIKTIIACSLVLLFFSCSHGPIKKIEQKRYTGSVKQKFSKKNIGLSQITSDDRSIYWGTEQGQVFRVEPQGMKRIWVVDVDDAVTTPVFSVGENLYVGTQKGSVICLSGVDGKIKWEKNYQTSIRGPFSVFQEHLFFVGLEGQVLGVDMNTGEEGFRQRFFVNNSFTLAYEFITATSGETMLVLLPNLEVMALNASLNVVWKKNLFKELGTGLMHGFVSIDALEKDTFLVTPYMEAPFVLSADGSLGVNFPSVKVTAPPVMDAEMAYFIGQREIYRVNTKSYAIDQTYAYKNSYPIGGALKVDEVLFVAGTNGAMDIFDLHKQEKVWTYYTESPLKGVPIYMNNAVWLLNQRGQIFAFKAPKKKLQK